MSEEKVYKYQAATYDDFLKLEPQEQLIRRIENMACGINLMVAVKALKAGDITQEQYDEFQNTCMEVYDALGLEQSSYLEKISKSGQMMVALGFVKGVTEDAKRKMN